MKKASVVFTLMFTLFGCSEPAARDLNGGDILGLSKENRDMWYAGFFTAMGHAVYMSSKSDEKSQCVWNWYFDHPKERNEQLEMSLEKYPDQKPTAIILALLRRDCGIYP